MLKPSVYFYRLTQVSTIIYYRIILYSCAYAIDEKESSVLVVMQIVIENKSLNQVTVHL